MYEVRVATANGSRIDRYPVPTAELAAKWQEELTVRGYSVNIIPVRPQAEVVELPGGNRSMLI